MAERFVRRTLSSGVDHMVVFLDAPRPRVRALLEEDPRVTVVRTGPDYWQGHRPTDPADRRRVNAGVACRALVGSDSVRWLVHLGADEALALDRERLLALDADHVRFRTWEAVARREWPDGEPRLFKKQPNRGELHALAALGRIPHPSIESLFRSHWEGRPGVRPTADARLGDHASYDVSGAEPEVEVPDDMHLLHHHRCTYDDFVQHWHDHPVDDLRELPARERRLAAAVHLVATSTTLDEAEREQALAELFDRQVADDVSLLAELDLVAPDPRRDVEARPLPTGEVQRLEARLAELAAGDKAELAATPGTAAGRTGAGEGDS